MTAAADWIARRKALTDAAHRKITGDDLTVGDYCGFCLDDWPCAASDRDQAVAALDAVLRLCDDPDMHAEWCRRYGSCGNAAWDCNCWPLGDIRRAITDHLGAS